MRFDLAHIDFVIALAVFLATVLGDILWAIYIRRTSAGKALSAATASLCIALLGGIAITQYVENAAYLIPTALGAFVGTLLTVSWDKRR